MCTQDLLERCEAHRRCSPRAHVLQVTKLQSYKATKLQSYKVTKLQSYKERRRGSVSAAFLVRFLVRRRRREYRLRPRWWELYL